MEKYYIYILFSELIDRYYVGHCEDLEERLRRHNQGNGSKFTKKAKDWQLKWSRSFDTRAAAAKAQRKIKKSKSRTYIEHLISSEPSN